MNLRAPYDVPYTADLKASPKATRTSVAVMPHGNLATKEGGLTDHPDAPAILVQPGSTYTNFSTTALGFSSRGEKRRVEEFLAHFGLTLAPVSCFYCQLVGQGGRLLTWQNGSSMMYEGSFTPIAIHHTVMYVSSLWVISEILFNVFTYIKSYYRCT